MAPHYHVLVVPVGSYIHCNRIIINYCISNTVNAAIIIWAKVNSGLCWPEVFHFRLRRASHSFTGAFGNLLISVLILFQPYFRFKSPILCFRTKETLESGHFLSVINILMQLRKVSHSFFISYRVITGISFFFSFALLIIFAWKRRITNFNYSYSYCYPYSYSYSYYFLRK